jgi:3-ketosteroid 9alpha-monooxygenase subunit A
MFGEGFMQDVQIWLNKAPVQNPLLCEEDGPVYQLRRWYEQFYVDVAEVTPEMQERFEFEVDTTKANEYWRAEVAENLAAKAAQDAEPLVEEPAQPASRNHPDVEPLVEEPAQPASRNHAEA